MDDRQAELKFDLISQMGEHRVSLQDVFILYICILIIIIFY